SSDMLFVSNVAYSVCVSGFCPATVGMQILQTVGGSLLQPGISPPGRMSAVLAKPARTPMRISASARNRPVSQRGRGRLLRVGGAGSGGRVGRGLATGGRVARAGPGRYCVSISDTEGAGAADIRRVGRSSMSGA